MLTLYRRLLTLRRQEPALSVGSYAPLPEARGSVLAYLRTHGARRFLCALNLGHEPASVWLGELEGRVAVGTHRDRDGDWVGRTLVLRGDEALVAEII